MPNTQEQAQLLESFQGFLQEFSGVFLDPRHLSADTLDRLGELMLSINHSDNDYFDELQPLIVMRGLAHAMALPFKDGLPDQRLAGPHALAVTLARMLDEALEEANGEQRKHWEASRTAEAAKKKSGVGKRKPAKAA